MLSNRPYLSRAFYQWIVDSGLTPILILDANHPRCSVPFEYVDNGEMTLNISPSAIRDLKILNTHIEFKASFYGQVQEIYAPIKAIMSIYAEENGEGIFFDAEDDIEEEVVEKKRVSYLRSVEAGAHLDTVVQECSVNNDAKEGKRSRPQLKLVE